MKLEEALQKLEILIEEEHALLKEIKEKHIHNEYLQPIITQYFIDNKSEIWLLFLIAHSKR